MARISKNTTLLVTDMQAGILGHTPNITTVINNINNAITTARKNKILVIYVLVGFRSGMPEIIMNNKGFAASKANLGKVDMNELMKIASALAPQSDDITVVKRRTSAFTGSDLEVILRAKGTQHIVLTGVSTSGVVLSTVRQVADNDFQITVLSDGDEEIHRVLMNKIFPRQADVLTVEQWK